MLEVDGGKAQRFKRVGGSKSLWEIKVKASSDGDVSLTLPATTDCEAAYAVCSAGGEPLSAAISMTVPGPSSASTPQQEQQSPLQTPNLGNVLRGALDNTLTPIHDQDPDPDPEPTNRPNGLTATVSGSTIVLTWQPPDGGVNGDIYNIYRQRPEQGEAELLPYVSFLTSSGRTYTDGDVEAGVLYKYWVKAIVDFFGNTGDASWPASARMPKSESGTQSLPPVIKGTAQEGQTLTVTTGPISGDGGRTQDDYSYQWYQLLDAGSSPLSGETEATLIVPYHVVGNRLKVQVSFTDSGGNALSLYSDPTAIVAAKPANRPATGEPVITGTLRVGETLSVITSAIEDDDGLDQPGYRFRWYAVRDGEATQVFGGGGPRRFSIQDSLLGDQLYVEAWFTDNAGYQEMRRSQSTAAITAGNVAADGLVVIAGEPRVGQTLRANTSLIEDDNGLTGAVYSYQWIRKAPGKAGKAIKDATRAAYKLVDADQGKKILLRVSFVDDLGGSESLTSWPTQEVLSRFSARNQHDQELTVGNYGPPPAGYYPNKCHDGISQNSKHRPERVNTALRDDGIKVAWQLPVKVTYIYKACNGGAVEASRMLTAFEVYRKTFYRTKTDWTRIATIPVTSDNMGMPSRVTYELLDNSDLAKRAQVQSAYAVRAIFGAANRGSWFSEQATIWREDDVDRPNAESPQNVSALIPTKLAVAGGATLGIQVSWDAPSQNASAVTGYRIERRIVDRDPSTNNMEEGRVWYKQVATTNASTTEWFDSSSDVVKPGTPAQIRDHTQFSYRIVAVRDTVASHPSHEASTDWLHQRPADGLVTVTQVTAHSVSLKVDWNHPNVPCLRGHQGCEYRDLRPRRRQRPGWLRRRNKSRDRSNLFRYRRRRRRRRRQSQALHPAWPRRRHDVPLRGRFLRRQRRAACDRRQDALVSQPPWRRVEHRLVPQLLRRRGPRDDQGVRQAGRHQSGG